jgi:hypothetical protein
MASIAERLAERGWHVFPCLPGDKRPAISRWEQRACAIPRLAARYWPSARHNVGVACGPSNLVVLDLDVSPDDALGVSERLAPYGAQQLARITRELGQPWPDTFTVTTPSGGRHLYFIAIDGREIRNSASKIAPKVDVRAAGGYVVAPGSVVGGCRYEITEDRAPVRLPAWLADLASPPPVVPPRVMALPAVSPGGYGGAALRGEVELLAAAMPGGRNAQLNRAAFSLGTLVAAGTLSEGTVVQALREAAQQNGLMADDGERRCVATIRSGLRAGMANPRRVSA